MIETTDNDDETFIEIVSNVLRISAGLAQPKDIFVLKVDKWFDHKWLEFSGKALGKLGVWNADLRVPPFTPDRVVGQTRFQRFGEDYKQVESKDLHVYQRSGDNLQRKLNQVSNSAIFIWFSGETATHQQASLMHYFVSKDFRNAWYASFKKSECWQIHKTKNIPKGEVSALIENDVLAVTR